MRTLHFTVIGEDKLHCAGCEARVANALKRVPGVTDVAASAETQHIAVTIDPAQATPEQVQAKLEQMGYSVKSGISA